MKIIVCVKQVPDVTEVAFSQETNSLIREGVKSKTNPFDKYAIEAALVLKEKYGGSVIAMSMGPPQAVSVLQDAVGMGVDDAVLLSDKAFAGADTLATAFTLSLGIKKLGEFDLIILGKQSTDGSTGQVGPQVAECLDCPHVTNVRNIEIDHSATPRLTEAVCESGYQLIQIRHLA